MSAVIHIENLSKKFLLRRCGSPATLKEAVAGSLTRLWHYCRGIESDIGSEEFWALRELTFTIEAGDRVGIVGDNGAGKSTFLKILSRIVMPTSGSVRVSGRVASLLEVGTGFHPELTGRENIYLNGAILGMSAGEIAAHFDAIVAFADIERFLDTPVKRYSSGMFARLGFSIAAHLDPDILIVDEVLSVGDISFQERCLKKLGDLSGAGKTILFVSHNLGAVMTLCNRGIYLEKGRVVAAAPIGECVDSYLRRTKTLRRGWEGNLGDDRVVIRRFHLEGMERDYCLQGETVTVTMDIEVLKSTQGLIVGFDLHSSGGYPLASVRSSENRSIHNMLEVAGEYRLRFQLETKVLRQGDYRLVGVCLVHNDRQLVGEQISLQLPIYPCGTDERFRHPHCGPGLFLGDGWHCERKGHG